MGNCWPSPLDDSVHNYEDTSKTNSSSGGGGGTVTAGVPPSTTTGEIITPKLKVFTYGELKSATRNFRPATMVGEGGFGRVFKGWIDPETYEPARPRTGIAVAVKKSNPDSAQGHKEWQAEVNFLGKFCHPNLVKLLGYCWEDRQFLLVYEYVMRGSLEGHLFRMGAETLSWETRLKIATGAARGLAFLHSTEKKVIYRDFKAANILLDEDFNAKLSDFGLAKLGPVNGDTHVTTQIVGTYGYAAPEYMATGHVYIKSDVYGFGVVLLEILTGRKVYDPQRPTMEHNLVEWAKPSLPNKRNLKKLMDPKLEENYPIRGAFQAAQLVLKCLEPDQKKRPSMEEVLGTLQQVNAIKMKPREVTSSAEAQNHRQREPANYNRYNASPVRHGHGGNGNVGAVGGRGARSPLPGFR